jgi:6-pyruvoyl-tetrahydropterin synthase
VEVTLDGSVKEDGMVWDFSLLKERFNHILDAFDHTFIVNNEDKVLVKLAPFLSSRFIIFTGNPTAENMSQYFFNYINASLKADPSNTDVIISSVTVWETVTGKATCNHAGNAEVPILICSNAVTSKWKSQEITTFLNNNGAVLEKSPLIAHLDIEETSDENTLKILATFKNCK